MTLELPGALFLLFVLPVLAWLFKRRPPSLGWPSLLAWNESGPASTARRRGPPRSWYALAAAAVLILAMARPSVSLSTGGRTIGLVIDRSASLAALRSDGTTRLHVLRGALRSRIESLSEGDRLRFWLTPDAPDRPEENLSRDDSLRRIGQLEAVSAADDLEATVDRALKARAAGAVDAIWIATDELPAPLAALGEETDGIAVLTAGGAAANDGIVFAAVVERGDGLRLEAAIVRTETAASGRAMELRVDGALVDRQVVRPTTSQTATFDLGAAARTQAREIELALTDSDALSADDRWLIRRMPPRRIRVAMAGSAPPALQRALAALDCVALVDVSEADLIFCVDAPPPADSAAWVGFGSAGRDRLALGSEVSLLGLLVAPSARDFRGLDLGDVAIGRAREVMGGTAEVLASTEGGSVCVGARRRQGLALGFGPSSPGFAASPSFPLLVRRSVERVGGSGREAGWRSFRTGDEIEVAARAVREARLVEASGRPQEIRPLEGSFRFRCLTCGWARFSAADEEWVYALNLASTRESRLGGAGPVRSQGRWLAAGRDSRRGTGLEPAFCALALGLLFLAWRPRVSSLLWARSRSGGA